MDQTTWEIAVDVRKMLKFILDNLSGLLYVLLVGSYEHGNVWIPQTGDFLTKWTIIGSLTTLFHAVI